MIVIHWNIPTYDFIKKEWSRTNFDTQKEFGEFLLNDCFKEPGDYDFDQSVRDWNIVATKFKKEQSYTDYSADTPEYTNFWDFEEDKCRLGVIWRNGKKVWYTTRDYYFLLNYCPIINKEKGQAEPFIQVRDVQYHMMLYEKIAEVFHKHSAILKRRQMAYSFCHVAKALNFIWFENKTTVKILASDAAYIDSVKGAWKTVNSYKEHINLHTDWYRAFDPGEYPQIQQVERRKDSKTKQWIRKGNESTLAAITLQKDVTSAVGGPGYWYWHEEGGIAPKADETLMYIEPALENGYEKSGSFCIGGSVGDLTACKPLQGFIKEPDTWGIFSVPTKWFDETGTTHQCGLFIPTQYGMPQAVDEYGNTQVELALKILAGQEEEWKKLPPEMYVLRKSQNPKTIKEAFAWRRQSKYPIAAIERAQERIKEKWKNNLWETKPIKCLLYRGDKGHVLYNTKDLPPEVEYPVDPKMVDKRGNVIIYEEPDKHAPPFTYFAGVDPVEADITTSSSSVFSISIWKKPTEEEYIDDSGNKAIRIVGDKMVACWRGRFDSVADTNAHALLLIELYKAYTLAERNKPGFINEAKRTRKTHMFAKESELPIMKEDHDAGRRDGSLIGFYKGSNGKASKHIEQFEKEFIDFLNAEYGVVHILDKEGNQTDMRSRVYTGLDRIPDYWCLEEFKLYNEENLDNFDRVISDLAGYYIMRLYSLNMGIERKTVRKEKPPTKPNQHYYNYLDIQTGSKYQPSNDFEY